MKALITSSTQLDTHLFNHSAQLMTQQFPQESLQNQEQMYCCLYILHLKLCVVMDQPAGQAVLSPLVQYCRPHSVGLLQCSGGRRRRADFIGADLGGASAAVSTREGHGDGTYQAGGCAVRVGRTPSCRLMVVAQQPCGSKGACRMPKGLSGEVAPSSGHGGADCKRMASLTMMRTCGQAGALGGTSRSLHSV